ncbi:hypothetical protein [Tropicimonas sediminicola]|uniref:Uncharacterized protein n=1 Tax=Tropicimonas sediminicola TaxID=1031541 RepID=A0A239LVH4_9RHOB|nr:hypothetical protein [Tropicimonas sediminicola]SNT33709.1 hypothetical protein SAMN05421757_11138 [Tropicimonas sediminicola]
MAIAVLLISTFIASGAAIIAALAGHGVLTIIAAFCVSGWVASIVLTVLMVLRAYVPKPDSGDDDRQPVTA